ncbi:glutamate--cysteine ligase [Streptomyces sp. NPDC053431]|uniref:glutamate--cysteine ligase n=1 Tax=Streptomyces sp. NPDC053431 TaxID=3365703 RepID=UPI0037D517CC
MAVTGPGGAESERPSAVGSTPGSTSSSGPQAAGTSPSGPQAAGAPPSSPQAAGPPAAGTPSSGPPSFGVEEEYFLVDPASGRIVDAAERVLARARAEPGAGDAVTGEFTRYQVEVRTPPCTTSGELRAALAELRRSTARAARAEGLRLCASGTPVLGEPTPDAIGAHPRYRAGLAQYRSMMRDFTLCAQHVHVHCPDRERAVLVGNHLRPVLPGLVALSANSPYHAGHDTDYASWRAAVRQRFPCLGPPPYAVSLAQSRQQAEVIAAAGAMLDPALPFWDVRPNPRFPTVEVRCPDVAAELEDAVAMAALVRALVTVADRRAARGDPGPRVGAEELRAAYWQAARDGTAGEAVDLATGRTVPGFEPVLGLLARVRETLEATGDWDLVRVRVRRVLAGGAGAEAQRRAAGKVGLSGLVRALADATELGAPEDAAAGAPGEGREGPPRSAVAEGAGGAATWRKRG